MVPSLTSPFPFSSDFDAAIDDAVGAALEVETKTNDGSVPSVLPRQLYSLKVTREQDDFFSIQLSPGDYKILTRSIQTCLNDCPETFWKKAKVMRSVLKQLEDRQKGAHNETVIKLTNVKITQFFLSRDWNDKYILQFVQAIKALPKPAKRQRSNSFSARVVPPKTSKVSSIRRASSTLLASDVVQAADPFALYAKAISLVETDPHGTLDIVNELIALNGGLPEPEPTDTPFDITAFLSEEWS